MNAITHNRETDFLNRHNFKAAAYYFIFVFAIGFMFGVFRELWMVPRIGQQTAELIEMPFMFMAIVIAAYWIMRRLRVPPILAQRLIIGLLSLSFMLLAELATIYWVRGLSLAEYIDSREPALGIIYIVMLLLYAFMPMLLASENGDKTG